MRLRVKNLAKVSKGKIKSPLRTNVDGEKKIIAQGFSSLKIIPVMLKGPVVFHAVRCFPEFGHLVEKHEIFHCMNRNYQNLRKNKTG